jgi:hypothetical protein
VRIKNHARALIYRNRSNRHKAELVRERLVICLAMVQFVQPLRTIKSFRLASAENPPVKAVQLILQQCACLLDFPDSGIRTSSL